MRVHFDKCAGHITGTPQEILKLAIACRGRERELDSYVKNATDKFSKAFSDLARDYGKMADLINAAYEARK